MADAASHASYLPTILAFCAGAVIAVPIVRRFGLSAVLGYLAAGVAIGPSALGIVTDPASIRSVAEIGVVLLLFIIGLELQPSRLLSMRADIFGAGTAQMAICSAALGGAAYALGLSWQGALVVGFALAVSGTAIAMQLLDERGDMGAPYGRRTFSILLMQDIMTAPFLAVIPLLAVAGGAGELSGALKAVGIAVAATAAIVLAGRYLLNPFFALLARYGAREVMTAAALLVVLGAAVLMERAGLSMALGAFLAGVLLAESNFRHELEADIEPFRGVLLGLFFMAVGMSVDLRIVAQNWVFVAIAAPLLVMAKIAMVAALLRATCSSGRDAIRAGALLSTAGEFAFVLIPLAGALGLISARDMALGTAIAAITMLLGPLAAKLIDGWLARRGPAAETMEEDFDGAGGSVIIIGFGRFGQIVTQTMLTQAVQVTVIDRNVERIRSAARFGFRIYYGDGARLDVLRAAGAARAKVIAVAVDDQEAAKRIIEIAKQEFPQARVIARAYDRVHAIALMELGVDRFVRETFESALHFGRVTLETLGLSADEAIEIVADVRRRDLQRLEAQRQDGILARPDLLRTGQPAVTPEPLSQPRTPARALTQETQAVITEQPQRQSESLPS